jgi:hypothetical protein
MGEDMNRRTAEQGTAEYRSEEILSHFFQKLLLFEIPCSTFDIHNMKEADICWSNGAQRF